MKKLEVTRAHLKKAVDEQNWDLLDKLLEIDSSNIDDSSLYTDTWGEWWGLMLQCVLKKYEDGVRILLKHGADPKKGNWGDCIPITPAEYARKNNLKTILKLLKGKIKPEYERKTEPELPPLNAKDNAVNQQGKTRDDTGLVFPTDNFL